MNSDVNHLLEEFEKLTLEEKIYLTQMIRGKLAEARHDQHADRLWEVRENVRKTKTHSPADLFPAK